MKLNILSLLRARNEWPEREPFVRKIDRTVAIGNHVNGYRGGIVIESVRITCNDHVHPTTIEARACAKEVTDGRYALPNEPEGHQSPQG